jgi:dephospho-CoA kinase
MLVVGLTGGIGSGKSAVAERFARRAVPVIDTDVIAHDLTRAGSTALQEIRRHFGDAILAADGALDRAALRRLVFADPAARRVLESILHPRIRQGVAQQLAALDVPYALVVVPLLVETGGWGDTVQRVLLVDCPASIRIERVMRRSGLSRADVLAIMSAQADDAARRAVADDVLDNTGAPGDLDAAVAQLHARYLLLAGTHLP